MPPRAGDVPIFAFHSVDPDVFRGDLEFLRGNGYRALSTEELVERRHARRGNREVLLTFDDAPRNFWEIAFPLLREYDTRATLFVPTHWVGGAAGPQGGPLPEDHPDRQEFMTWEQLRDCHRSGLVDVQSHAHRHALVYTSRSLVGFASPVLLARHHLYDWPMRRVAGHDALGRPPLGAPIYEATPLLSARQRVLENETVVNACIECVAAHGGAAWFSDRSWRRELLRVHAGAARRSAGLELASDEDFAALIESEFQLSKRMFETELGSAPRYLAFPWMLGSLRSLEAAAGAGIRAVFGVGLDFRRARGRTGAPLPAFARVKGEWLRFLPGRGRSRLGTVLPPKIRGFFRAQHLAH